MENEVSSFDFSSAAKFFTEAIKIAHEKGKKTDKDYVDLKEIPVASGESMAASLYDDLPEISFKKFYAEKGTKYNKETCIDYHKIIIIADGRCLIETDEDEIILPDDRKFYYLVDGLSFTIEFFEETWFYVILLPS